MQTAYPTTTWIRRPAPKIKTAAARPACAGPAQVPASATPAAALANQATPPAAELAPHSRPLRRAVAAASFLLAIVLATVAPRESVAAPGIYDTSFGPGGLVLRDVGPGHDIARAAAVQPDGKIVVVGGCSKTAGNGARAWCIARFNSSGALDTGFAGSGIVQLSGTTDQYATAVAVAPDGNIFVGGTCDAKFCVYRLSASGGVYTNYGSPVAGGSRALFGPAGYVMEARTMLLQPDGRVLVGGSCYNASLVESSCIVRFNTDGSVDSGFGGAASGGVQFGFFSGQILRVTALALQADGKIVYTGSHNPGSAFAWMRGRINSNGSFDGSFTTALLAPSGSGNSLAGGIAIQADGKVLIGGTCTVSSSQRFCIMRLNGNDGSIDNSFASAGTFIASINVLPGGVGTSLVLQPDGKPVLSGTYSSNFAAIRLNDDGSLDTTWAGGGYTFGNINNGDQLYGSTLQPDGKLLWIGQCTLSGTDPAFCVQRIDGGPYGAPACSPDIDGDGQVLGPTDLLILSRVQRGVGGAAVIGGISFGAGATRNTWPSIRQYLIAQCALTVKD